MDSIAQFFIVILGGLSIWCISRKEHWSRWGFIIGLLSSPPYFYTTYVNEQWGMVALTAWYSYSYCQGIYNYWIKKD